MENQTDEKVLRFIGIILFILGIIVLPLSALIGFLLLDSSSDFNPIHFFVYGPLAGIALIIWGSLFKVLANISISLKNSSNK